MRLNAFSYMGGKSYLASWIIKHMSWHNIYVEVFGGGANVLLQKPRSKIEVLNDYDEDIFNFYKIMLEEGDKFWEKINYLPYSRKLYYEYLKEWENGNKGRNNLERAVRWYYLQSLGFSGMIGKTFRIGIKKNVSASFFQKTQKFPFIIRRLQGTIIENLDFEECIKKYDSTKTLFYCDPPYWFDKNYYKINFKEEDHIRLSNILNKIKGNAIVSYYYNKKLKKYYSDWFFDEKVITKFSYYNKNGNKNMGKELLLTNYKIKGLKQLKNYV